MTVNPNPKPTLNAIEAGAVIVGVVIGVGIFKTPALVAANVDSETSFLLIWLIGGLISLMGALCYGELATAYPHPGGEYHYLTRSCGKEIALLFAWARLGVMQTGSIALLAFVFGDYFSQLFPLGDRASSLMYQVLGEVGAQFISLLVAISALGAMQGTMTTGARTNYALGQDWKLLGWLGHWHERTQTPLNALLVQSIITLALILLGTLTRTGFATMVEYTAPVFWFFLLLTTLSLFVLRTVEPEVSRAFRVPLYPLTPLLFCATCVYMLQASLTYTGIGALVGVGVLLSGIPLLLIVRH